MPYQPGTAVSTTIPFPILGWNTRDPIDQMDPNYAQVMDNIFPAEQKGQLRSGSATYVSTGFSGKPAKTLYEHVNADASRVFIAAANGHIWNISTSTPSSLGSGFTSDAWQVVHDKLFSIFLNGKDTPQKFDGTTLSNTSFSGISDPTTLIQGTLYRNRFYATAGDQTFWYGGLDAISGALAQFDCSTLLSKGGGIQFLTTWTRDSGQTTSELFVVVSTEGEILIFQGSYPGEDGSTQGSTAWALVGHIFLAKTLGPRAFQQYQSEIEIETQLGIVPLSQAVSNQLVPGQEGTLTDKIAPTFNSVATMFGTNFGWSAHLYPQAKMAIYNIPISANSQSLQFVRNLITGAWCRFTGWDAATFCVFEDKLYYSTWDGEVRQALTQETDAGALINYELLYAYNYLGDGEHSKHAQKVRPLILADNDITLGIGIDIDFNPSTISPVEVVGVLGNLWDVPNWDSVHWADENLYNDTWYDVAGIGRAFALHFKGAVSNANFSLASTHILYDVAEGFL